MTYLSMASLGTVTVPTRSVCLEVLTALQKSTGKVLRTVWGYSIDPAEVAAYLADGGWLPVVETPRPADTTTHTHRAVYTLAGQTVTQTWQQVAKSAEQVAAEKHAADLATLRSDIVTKAITWLEADSQQAQTRAAAISNATPARQRPRLPCGVGGAFVMSRLTDKVDS